MKNRQFEAWAAAQLQWRLASKMRRTTSPAVWMKSIDPRPHRVQSSHLIPPPMMTISPPSHDQLLARVPAEQGDTSQQVSNASTQLEHELTSRPANRWTPDEHERFLRGLEMFPHGPWSRIAALVGTRTTRQTMTHGQKYRERITRRSSERQASFFEEVRIIRAQSAPATTPGSYGAYAPTGFTSQYDTTHYCSDGQSGDSLGTELDAFDLHILSSLLGDECDGGEEATSVEADDITMDDGSQDIEDDHGLPSLFSLH